MVQDERADEREQCAQISADIAERGDEIGSPCSHIADTITDLIRNRSTEESN